MRKVRDILNSIRAMISRIPLWVWLLVIGGIAYCTYTIIITADMSDYMNLGLNLYLGKGYVNPHNSLIMGRPLFPLMIAVSFQLLGVSPWSAFWVVRIFAIANPIVIYLLGRKFFDERTGFVAGLLMLTSSPMLFWAYRHVDAVWPCFALLAILFMWHAFERDDNRYLALSAVLLCLSYFVKQVALLLFPLPLLMWLVIKDYRTRKRMVGVCLFLAISLLILSLWGLYISAAVGGTEILGRGGFLALFSYADKGMGNAVKSYLSGLTSYFIGHRNSITKHLILSPLFIIGWAYVFITAFKDRKGSIVLVGAFLLLSPYIAFVGKYDLRSQSAMAFLMLSYLSLAALLMGIRGHKGVIAVAALIAIQMAAPYVYETATRGHFLADSRMIRTFRGRRLKPHIGGVYGDVCALPRLAEWIKGHIPRGANIMCDWYMYGWGTYFYTGGDYGVYGMPVIGELGGIEPGGWEPVDGNIIFLSAWTGYEEPRNRFFALSEKSLFDDIKEKDIRYIVTIDRWARLSEYFMAHPGFEMVADMETRRPGTKMDRVRVFAVKDAGPLPAFDTIVDENAVRFWEGLFVKNRPRYDFLKKEFFGHALGWDEAHMKIIGGNI